MPATVPNEAPPTPGDSKPVRPKGLPPLLTGRPLLAWLAVLLLVQLAQSFWSTWQQAVIWANGAAAIAAEGDPTSSDWPARAAALTAEHPGLHGAVRAVEFVGTASGAHAHLGSLPSLWTPSVTAPVVSAGRPAGAVRVYLAWLDWLAPLLPSLALAAVIVALARLFQRDEHAWRERVQATRHAGQAAWRTLFQSCHDALVLCDGDGLIVAVNDHAASLFGLSPDKTVGRALADLVAASPGPSHDEIQTEIRHADGERVPVLLLCLPAQVSLGDGRLWRLTDLREQRQTAQRMVELAHYDSLTGLPNRQLFRDRLQRAMDRAVRSGRPMALMFLDLDRFKVVNDSLGHSVGDELLRYVADVLSGCLRSVDTVLGPSTEEATVSRLGGDEFTVILEDIGGVDDAAMVARRILEALDKPFSTGHEDIVVSASIGVALYPTEDVDLDGLLRHADMAMYRSKSLGRSTFSFFSDDLTNAVKARVSLEGSLRRALERNEFVLHYQPKVDLATGKLTGVEALLRWHCPGKGMVPPDRFISVLEDTGLILPAGAWVIRTALEEMEHWDRVGLPPINVAVNLSARQLRHQFLASLIEDSLGQHRIAAHRLELELTESLLMEDTEGTRDMLDTFARIGLRLAIDDFGTGHSSLAYLRRFKVDTLKIDRSFISETPHDSEACAVATAIVALGRSMQIKLVAEGVESDEQAAFLRDLGCHEIQGYLLTRPLPLPQLIEWYRAYEAQRRDPDAFGDEPDTLPGGLLLFADEVASA